MISRKAFLVLIVCLGMTALTGKEARAASCSLGWDYWDSQAAAQKTLRNCIENAFVPVASAHDPFAWGGRTNSPSGTFGLSDWIYYDEFVVDYDLRYNLTRHGFSSSLDGALPGTSFSSVSFTISATEEAALRMGITLDEWSMGVTARGRAALSSARLDFTLAEAVTWTEGLDSRSLFLSAFANTYGGDYDGNEGNYIAALGTWATLSGFRADVVSVVPVPLPPALALLLGGLVGLGALGRRRRSRAAAA